MYPCYVWDVPPPLPPLIPWISLVPLKAGFPHQGRPRLCGADEVHNQGKNYHNHYYGVCGKVAGAAPRGRWGEREACVCFSGGVFVLGLLCILVLFSSCLILVWLCVFF